MTLRSEASTQFVLSFSEFVADFIGASRGRHVKALLKAYLHTDYTDERPDEIRAAGLLADPQASCGPRKHHSATSLTGPEAAAFLDFIVSLNPHGEQDIVRAGQLSLNSCISRFLEGLAAEYYHNNQPPKPRKPYKPPRIYYPGEPPIATKPNKRLHLPALTRPQLEDRLLYINLDLQEGANPTLERERDTINDLLARAKNTQHPANS